MKKYIILLILIPLIQLGYSQERGSKVMEQVEAQKVAFFTQKLDLSVEESQVFWPIYNEYQEEQQKLRKDFRSDYGKQNLSDSEATEAISAYFVMEDKELSLKKQLYVDLSGAIPPGKLVKLQFVENQFKQKLLERIKKRRETRKK